MPRSYNVITMWWFEPILQQSGFSEDRLPCLVQLQASWAPFLLIRKQNSSWNLVRRINELCVVCAWCGVTMHDIQHHVGLWMCRRCVHFAEQSIRSLSAAQTHFDGKISTHANHCLGSNPGCKTACAAPIIYEKFAFIISSPLNIFLLLSGDHDDINSRADQHVSPYVEPSSSQSQVGDLADVEPVTRLDWLSWACVFPPSSILGDNH